MRRGEQLLVGLCLCVPAAALAHSADLVAAELRVIDGGVEEKLTVTPATMALLVPVDADGDGQLSQGDLDGRGDAIAAGVWADAPLWSGSEKCTLVDASATLRAGLVELWAKHRCGQGELAQEFRLLSVLPSNYQVVAALEGLPGQRFAKGAQQRVVFTPLQATGAAAPGLGGWVRLGVFHIFTGFDHLAFLIALLLVGGSWRRVLLMVTAFTVAHSITLGCSALGMIELSSRAAGWVEVAIAVSIVWVAAENMLLHEHRHRAVLTFAFGLVHGFGFASALAGYGLGEHVVMGLFGFNLGVELGQTCVVLAVLPVIRAWSRHDRSWRWAFRLGSVGLGCAGAYLLVDRLIAG